MSEFEDSSLWYMNAIKVRLGLETQGGVVYSAHSKKPYAVLSEDAIVPESSEWVRRFYTQKMLPDVDTPLLEQYVDSVRLDVLTSGQPWTLSEDYQGHGITHSRSLIECRRRFWKNLGLINSSADLDEPDAEVAKNDALLGLYDHQGSDNIRISFSFADTYSLRIGFGSPVQMEGAKVGITRIVGEYITPQLPTSQMNYSEYAIIMHTIERYKKAA